MHEYSSTYSTCKNLLFVVTQISMLEVAVNKRNKLIKPII